MLEDRELDLPLGNDEDDDEEEEEAVLVVFLDSVVISSTSGKDTPGMSLDVELEELLTVDVTSTASPSLGSNG